MFSYFHNNALFNALLIKRPFISLKEYLQNIKRIIPFLIFILFFPNYLRENIGIFKIIAKVLSKTSKELFHFFWSFFCELIILWSINYSF